VLQVVGVARDQTHGETVLARKDAILVWDALPIRFIGPGLLASATGPVAAWTPNAEQYWSWAGVDGAFTPRGLGFLHVAAVELDDLLRVLRLF
jgi:hypothetical protein